MILLSAAAFASDLTVTIQTADLDETVTFADVEHHAPPALLFGGDDVDRRCDVSAVEVAGQWRLTFTFSDVPARGRARMVSHPTLIVAPDQEGTVEQGSREGPTLRIVAVVHPTG